MGTDKRYAEAAARLGDVLADNDCTLYYGGGSIGLMNVIADRMLARGHDLLRDCKVLLRNPACLPAVQRNCEKNGNCSCIFADNMV